MVTGEYPAIVKNESGVLTSDQRERSRMRVTVGPTSSESSILVDREVLP